MITLHYLNNSRSQRILWLVEELCLDYTLRVYQRDPKTGLAPTSLKKIHPLGKVPIVQIDDLVISESAVIAEYIIENYDERDVFSVPISAEAKQQYNFWLHFAESSLMPPIVAKLVLKGGNEKVGLPFSWITSKFVQGVSDAYFDPYLEASLAFVESHLLENKTFVGGELTAADIQMLFPLEALVATGKANQYPAITAYVKRMHQREAYQRALQKGGEYAYAKSV